MGFAAKVLDDFQGRTVIHKWLYFKNVKAFNVGYTFIIVLQSVAVFREGFSSILFVFKNNAFDGG